MSIQRYELLRGSFENWLRLVVATLIIVISNIFILCHEYVNGDIAECTTLKQRDGILEAGQLSSQNAYYCRWRARKDAELWKKSPRNIIFRLEVASNIKPYSENQLATLTLIFLPQVISSVLLFLDLDIVCCEGRVLCSYGFCKLQAHHRGSDSRAGLCRVSPGTLVPTLHFTIYFSISRLIFTNYCLIVNSSKEAFWILPLPLDRMPKGRHCNPCTRNDGQWVGKIETTFIKTFVLRNFIKQWKNILSNGPVCLNSH